MTTEATQLAERLLDAQVAFVTAELTGPDTAELVATEVASVLAAVNEVPLGELVDRTALRATVRTGIETVGASPGVAEAVPSLVEVARDLPANDDTDLADVVDRTAVAAIVDVLVASETLREEVLRRLRQSPAMSTLAMRFVSALVGDAVQQNRERAEKMPGVKSILGVGDFAARQARGMAPKQLERVVGGAADRSAQAAMERVSRALVDTFDEEAVRRAALEMWDLHGEDRVAGVQAYLTTDEIDRIASHGHDVWDGMHSSPWFRDVVDAAVDAFFDRYQDVTIGGLLGDFGLDADTIATEVARHAPRLLAALHRHGHLEAVVRRRLEPFFRSDAALAILTAQS